MTSELRSIPLDGAVCIGETMSLVTPIGTGGLLDGQDFALTLAGAESNVAVHLARAKITTQWASQLGNDPLGKRIRNELSIYGVATDFVAMSNVHPTGVFFKDPTPSSTEVYYYRSGSAASHMTFSSVQGALNWGPRLVHLTGITPSLSRQCFEMTTQVLQQVGQNPDQLVSFDVNYRPKMWSVQDAQQPLLEFAREADIVFVGRDEAEVLWGTATPQQIRELLPSVRYLVVKDADVGATEYCGDQETFVSAPEVNVLEPVGAGDAFAGGYLAALLSGYSAKDRLMQGHVIAGQVLVVPGDLPPVNKPFGWIR